MGLEITLKYCPNFEFAQQQYQQFLKKMDEFLAYIERMNGPRERWTDRLKQDVSTQYRYEEARLKEKYNVQHGEHQSVSTIKNDSANYPDHLFKVGYFRSSYNSLGFDSVMNALGLLELGEIFPEEWSAYYVVCPDWNAAQERAKATRYDFQNSLTIHSVWISQFLHEPFPDKKAGEYPTIEWYRMALDIVCETVDWVLATGEAENYYLYWQT